MPSILKKFSGLFARKGATMGAIPPSGAPGFFSQFQSGFSQGVSRLFRQRDAEEYLEEYRGIVYACVKAICEEIAVAKIKLYRKTSDGHEEVKKHPALDLLSSVNASMTFYDLMYTTQASTELDGNAFWYLPRENGRTPSAIWPLRPDRVAPIPGKERWVDGYLYQAGSARLVVPPEQIIHFKEFNPLNAYRGVGTVMAAMGSIDTKNSITAWNQGFFDNGARPGMVVEYSGNLSQEDREKLQRSWNDQYRGSTKGHQTAFLGGGLKAVPLEVSQKEMDFVEQARLTRDEILSIFRVPQSVLGITQDMTYSNAETTNYIFALRTILPKLTKIVNTLNEFYLPMFEGSEELVFMADDPVPQNQELKLTYYQNGITNGWLTPNEVRAREGLQPIEGGDAVRVPTSFSLGGATVRAVREPNKKEEVPEDIKKLASSIASIFKDAEKHDKFERDGEAWNKAQRKRGDDGVKNVKAAIADFLDEQSKRVVAAFKGEATKAARRVSNKAINIDNVFDEEDEAKRLAEVAMEVLKPVVKAEGDAAADAVEGHLVMFDENASEVEKALAKQTQKFAKEATKTTAKAVRDTISAGYGEGLSVSDIAKSISDLGEFSEERANVIARTETVRAQGMADIEAWKQSGVVTQKIWYTALDERVCPSCNALHGTKIELEGTFLGKGEVLEYESDDTEGESDEYVNDYGDVDAPPLHPNCRCSTLPVIE